MKLNTLKPADGARATRRRVGRGIGSGLGKTCGRGHKGAKSRAGGSKGAGFEGGQMPIQRRLPKIGFTSKSKQFKAEVTLSELSKLASDVIDLGILKQNGILPCFIREAKVIKSGELAKKISIQGLAVTAGARAAIEASGGKVEL